VKELSVTRGVKQVITFYSAARLDGLVRREEVMGVKLSEHFTGRSDRLEYRSATFAPSTAGGAGGGGEAGGGSGEAGGPWGGTTGGGLLGGVERLSVGGGMMDGPGGGGLPPERLLPIVKISEKFARNPGVPADEDTAKRVFFIAEGRVLVRHAVAEGRLTGGYLQFSKDGAAQAVQVGGGGL
jgi:hypothetical protein